MSESEILRTYAFRLFEQEQYASCLNIIRTAPPHLIDIRLQIIEAVCLFSIGSLSEAEVCLRDLKGKVPDSAEVCLYLGKVLEQKGDDRARAEFAEAVQLAPEQPEGIRRYARYLTDSGDHRAALGLFRRLVLLTDDQTDLRDLMRCYDVLGGSNEGIAIYHQKGSPAGCFRVYLDLLLASGRYQDLVDAIESSLGTLQNPDLMGCYLDALIRINPDKADQAFLRHLKSNPSTTIASQYVRFLSSRGKFREALGVWSTWLAMSDHPEYRIQGAPLLEIVSGSDQAIALYQGILFADDLKELSDLPVWFSSYRDLLIRVHGPETALDQVLTFIRPELPVVLLLCIASWCEKLRRSDQAKRLFLQAFRSDLTTSGLAYAAFLGRSGENREQKKILWYVLKTVRKIRDLEAVVDGILALPDCDPDLITSVNTRFGISLPLLSQHGRELYARSLSRAAEYDLKHGNPDKALEHSLAGLAITPVDSVDLTESLFALLVACKSQVLPDYIPLPLCSAEKRQGPEKVADEFSLSWLDPGEEAVIEYLKKHRICNEMDLRKVAGTRRVAGLMNRIMRKSEEQGIHLAEKDGYTEFGEVYRYAGP
ncbi:MAG: hypothetical protein LUQ50_11025 [Methanospirillum sp.]|uniref:tetratricopeptide repeat protein n=1 Tax=Methanospirillum sp. TaxID=45200 RepID=UPI00236EBBD2|nr:hypothetical protein [Methanospirillum sp.]MDD1729586.1 hypothetical protein [Methanospirillum sp.]